MMERNPSMCKKAARVEEMCFEVQRGFVGRGRTVE